MTVNQKKTTFGYSQLILFGCLMVNAQCVPLNGITDSGNNQLIESNWSQIDKSLITLYNYVRYLMINNSLLLSVLSQSDPIKWLAPSVF